MNIHLRLSSGKALRRLFTASCFVGSLSVLETSHAQTTWTNNGGGSWTTGGNWSAGVPTSSVDARIRRTGFGTVTIGNGLNAQAQTVTIGFSGGPGFSNGSLTIASGGSLETDSVVVGGAGLLSGLTVSGLLITNQVSEGSSAGFVSFDGGTIRGTLDGAELFQNFENNDVGMTDDGMTVDTNGLNLKISQNLTGGGLLSFEALTVTGGGSLDLGGNNSYLNGTLVEGGTRILVSNNSNLGNALSVLTLDDGILEAKSNFSTARLTTIDSGGGTYHTGNGITFTHSGLHLGSGALSKTGSGTVVLTAVNFGYSGEITIEEGILQVGNGGDFGGLGTGNVVNNSVLAINRSDLFILPYLLFNTISGSGELRQIGSGTSLVTGANSYSGGTLLSNGILYVGNDEALGSGDVTITAGRLSYADGITLANSIVLDGNAEFSVFLNGWEATQSGGISGMGNFTKVNPGTLFLTADNTFVGDTAVNEGALSLGDGGTAGDIGGDVSVAGGATLEFNRSNLLDFTMRTISGTGNVIQQGSGTTRLGSNAGFSGGFAINAGSVVATQSNSFGTGNVNLVAGNLTTPAAPLNFNTLDWAGGTITVDLDGGSQINLTDAFNNTGTGGDFRVSSGTEGNTYTLVNFATTTFTQPEFTAQWSTPDVVLTGEFNLDTVSGNLTYTILGAAANGAILQNSNPVNVPTFADFTINGATTTGSPMENNMIKSLNFMPGSSLEVFNTLMVTTGNFHVGSGNAAIMGGNVMTPGSFNKTGNGMLDAQSNFGVGGSANIQEGGLMVNGTFQAGGGLTVFQNALLGGSGLIVANVFNNGTTAPGNSPGVLRIDGNFTQSSSGTLELEIASRTAFDRLIVSGRASLAGTLQVLASGKTLRYGQQYAFLSAGSISGEFDQILMPQPNRFRGRFLTNGGIGSLLVAPTSYVLVAETTNQKNVAKALDSYIPARNNDRETVSIALDIQTEDQYPAAFDQIAPTFHESIANIAIEQAFAQTQLLNQRMSSVRLGARGFQTMGVDAEPLVHDKDGKSLVKPVLEPEASKHWSVWAQGNGLFAKVTNVSQVPNYRFDSGGFLFGADYTFGEPPTVTTDNSGKKSVVVIRPAGPTLTTGLFAGYQGTYADYNGGGSTTINSALFGGYAAYSQGGFYADAVVSGGYNNAKVRRPIDFSTIDRTARSSQDGGQFSAALNLGYDWTVGGFTFGPIAGVQYTYVGIAPFEETGADSLNLRVSQQNANSLRTTFGGRIAYTWAATDKLTLIPEVRMFWQHEFLNNPRVIGAALDGGNGPGFDYLTSAPARDSVFAGAGLTAQFTDAWYASAYWNIDFGRQDFLSNIVSMNLGYKF